VEPTGLTVTACPRLGTAGCCGGAAVVSFLGLLFPHGLDWNHTGGITKKLAGEREILSSFRLTSPRDRGRE